MTDVTEILQTALHQQKQAYLAAPVPTLAERKQDLCALQQFVRDHKDAICEAINADYGHRSTHETLMGEVFPVLDGIAYILKALKGWMQPQRRAIDIRTSLGAKNRVIPQPLGVVGIIVPWNFPLNLSLLPLAFAFAAGNRAMLKMSENSRHLARLFIDTLPAYFPPEKLRVFDETGGIGIAFSALPFDHLLFTGSGTTGKSVMAAAAHNLCPVTLELGGKSPALVLEDFPIRTAAERILFAKCMNAGQICTTVDHLWLDAARVDAFVAAARDIVVQRYPTLASPDYTAIIDQRAFDRLLNALDEAQAGGATLIPLLPGPAFDHATRKIAPHLVLNAPENCALMTREIFGPILPIRTYTHWQQAVDSINAGERPLAFYPFSHDAATVQTMIDRVMSGGVSVNDALLHVAQHDLPFGGVGASGMGHYHGREGFHTFSKLRPVFYQARFSAFSLLMPPYGKLADAVLRFLTR